MKPLAMTLLVALLATLLFSPVHAEIPLTLTPAWAMENVGPWPAEVRFVVRHGAQTLWLLEDGLWLAEGEQMARVTFVGARRLSTLEGLERRSTRLSLWNERGYFAEVPVWRGVRYRGLYPGVDLLLDGAGFRWVGTARALRAVQVQVEGDPKLAQRLRMNLAPFTAGAGDAAPPFVTEALLGLPAPLTPAAPQGRAALTVWPDRPQDLLYSTFLGGTASEGALDAALGPDGSLYVTGDTLSTNFPVKPGGSFQGVADVFVARLKPDGSDVLFALLIGGADWDMARALAVDGSGNVVVVGETYSLSFPTSTGAFDRTRAGETDAFVLKLDAAGAFVYSTLLGGSGVDRAYDVALDSYGYAYIVGTTDSTDFLTTSGALDTSFNGDEDGFVAKLNPSGSLLSYATYLGGSALDAPRAVALDSMTNAYITGYTESADFPVTGEAFQPQLRSAQDAFVVRLGSSGGTLVYGTYLGGNGDDEAVDIALDTLNNAYVVGETYATDFPTTEGAWQRSFGGGATDAFFVKVSANGRTLSYGTYVGGSGKERLTRVRVASSAALYLAGHTDSSNFPLTAGAYNTQPQGGYDGVALFFNPLTSTLLYGTRLGGSEQDFVYGLAVSGDEVMLAGTTRSANFPVTSGAFDTTYNGNGDGFAFKFKLTYGIAGRVTDAQARPIKNVTLTVTPGNLTVQTGADGRYFMAGLTAGTYLVTPAKAGYSFEPVTRLVTLPPNVETADFVMTPLPATVIVTPGITRTVTLTDTIGQTTVITIPAEAVTQVTTVVVTLVPGQSGGGYYSPGMAFTLAATPEPGSFAVPLQAALTYAPGAAGPLVDKQNLRLWYWTGSDWVDAGATCDPAPAQTHDQVVRRVTAGFCRTGLYVLRGPTRQVNLPLVLKQK